ncbi:MAG: TetR family transcriptional regulator [Rubrivivax sp.]|nr:TetR family transcriptional regulator [Rubrivivax sp.]
MGRPIDLAKNRAILNAARLLLFRDGPRAFTVEAVAHAAGVSVTVYARNSRKPCACGHRPIGRRVVDGASTGARATP